MLLDAPTFQTIVTPEVALSIIQKEIARRRWPMELGEIRLSYVPFWSFSFDVLAEGAAPNGKAAINASSGDLDEFVPYILTRPFKKAKSSEEGAEVEPTNVSKAEAERVAPAKVASAVGVKKDAVSVSALAKVYVPIYHVWVSVPQLGEYKIDVDALTGSPVGLDQIPSKEKGWNEAAGEALDKMKTPKGWADLAGEAASTAGGAGKGGGPLSNKFVIWGVLILLILAVLYFVGRSGSAAVTCIPDRLEPPEYLGLFGNQYVSPLKTVGGNLVVRGTCKFTNKNPDQKTACVRLTVQRDALPVAFNTSCMLVPGNSDYPRESQFQVAFQGTTTARYTFAVEQTI